MSQPHVPVQASHSSSARQGLRVPQVLIAAGCPHATVTRYRCLHLQEQLAANGISATVEEWYDLDRIDAQHPLPEQALVIQRVAFTPALGELIGRMHAAERPVIFDVDDLVFEPSLAAWHRGAANLAPSEQQLYGEGVRRYLATLERCDHVLTASPLLAELAQRHGVAAHVHRNALDAEMLAWAGELYELRRERQSSERTGGERLVLGYGSGTPTHDVDFAEAAPAVMDILTRYAHAELWVAGPIRLPDELSGFGVRVRRFPLLAWRDWFELAVQIDINLAPLEMGNVFCRAKSEIKFVEAAALGIPTVASQIDPFAAVVIHGENGYWAANPAQWMEYLDCLVADAELRRRIGEAARNSVLERYSPQARAADLAQLLPELLNTSAEMNKDTSKHLPTSNSIRRATISRAAVTHAVATDVTSLDAMMGNAATDRAATADEGFVPLTIHWIVSEPITGSGGHAGIFRMIRHLVDFGHVCHVHMIPVNFMHGYTPVQIQCHVDEHFMPTGAVYHQWGGQIGPADVTVATFWRTVPPLLTLPLPGHRYYLVQDFEPYFYPMGLEYIQAESSYRQGLHCLTLGPWLARLIREEYRAEADHFDFAVDTEVYYPAAAGATVRPAHPRVAFYPRPSTPRRAYELGLEALQLVKQRSPGVEIIFFGAATLPPPPFPVTNAGLLNPWELAKLFASCDVGVVFSTTNPSFVPFEMMACRCAVVDLASERVVGLLEDGVNCRLAEPAPDSVAVAVLDLVWNQEQRAAIAETAYQQVKGKSWQHSALQIEEVLLQHSPAAQRVAYRVASGAACRDDIDMLAWQIHQLLDAGGDNAALVDALRRALYRSLAEKATLVQHVQEVEQRLAATQQAAPGAPARAALQPLADKLLDSAPAWLLSSAPLSKLALDQEPLCQSFCADRSHLRRIELRLAPRTAVHTGSIRIALYEGDERGRLVTSELLRVAELPLEQLCAVEFTPQADSYGKTYTLCVAAGELNRQPPAIWHFRQIQHAQAQLRRGRRADRPDGGQAGGRELPGQLAFQPFYGEHPPLLPPRQGPANWNEPIRPAPVVARELAERQGQEVKRLAGQARNELRQRGLGGLAREVLNYLQWQLLQRGQG